MPLFTANAPEPGNTSHENVNSTATTTTCLTRDSAGRDYKARESAFQWYSSAPAMPISRESIHKWIRNRGKLSALSPLIAAHSVQVGSEAKRSSRWAEPERGSSPSGRVEELLAAPPDLPSSRFDPWL